LKSSVARMNFMDLGLLRNFLVILQCGSITDAADRLGVAQPSLSQQLLRLEDELKIKLFTRTARGVMATEGARIFEQHARTILRDFERAREDVRGLDGVLSGKVTMGLPFSLSLLLGVPLLLAVKQQLPKVSLTLEEAMSGHIRQWLEDGTIDLALLYNADEFRHLSARPFVLEELCLVGRLGDFGPVDSQGMALQPVELAKVAPLRLILPTSRHGLRQFVNANTKGSIIADAVQMEVDSLQHIKALVAAGHGHSILSQAAIAEELKMKTLAAARLVDPPLQRQVHIVRNPSRITMRASVGVESLLIELVQSMIANRRWRVTMLSNGLHP
jgi:LysR family transcriptional regulator, nitrogen assimilation regulatory protein